MKPLFYISVFLVLSGCIERRGGGSFDSNDKDPDGDAGVSPSEGSDSGAETWADADAVAADTGPKWSRDAGSPPERDAGDGSSSHGDSGTPPPPACTSGWSTVTSANTPPASRIFHSAVWTGSEMIIWGGNVSSHETNDGARFNPTTGLWTSISNVGAPSPRWSTATVWTGSEMIVWGGGTEAVMSRADGGRYNPVTDTWLPMSSSGAPSDRFGGSSSLDGV